MLDPFDEIGVEEAYVFAFTPQRSYTHLDYDYDDDDVSWDETMDDFEGPYDGDWGEVPY